MGDFSKKELEALRHIRNSLMHNGRSPSIRELMKALGYRSPRSAQDILESLAKKEAVRKTAAGYVLQQDPSLTKGHVQTVDVPVVGTVAAGAPILADENIEGFVPISIALAKRGHKHFLLRVRGDSMNKAGINDGDFVLVRQQNTADPGQNVVALIDDDATVKEYRPQRDVVLLKPRSTNPKHKPIVLDREFSIQGVVIKTISNLE